MDILVFLLEVSPFCAIVYLYLYWNQCKSTKTPRVNYKKSLFNQLAVEYCSSFLKQPYCPTVWAFTPRFHSVYSTLFPKAPRVFNTEYLEASSCGLVGIVWPHCGEISLDSYSPIVIFVSSPLCYGLDKSLQPYIDAALQNGFRPAVFLPQESQCLPQIREPFLQHPTYCDGNISSEGAESDLGEVIEYINNKHPKSLIYIVGISYGNVTLMRFLAASEMSHYIAGAASVSPTWHKQSSGTAVSKPCQAEKPRRKLSSSQNLVSMFRRFAFKRSVSFQEDCNNNLNSITLPTEMFGRLKRILSPVIVIYSKDDPFISAEERNRVGGLWKNSDFLMTVETSNGGHVGFFQGLKPQSWAALLVFQYFEAVGKFRDATVEGMKTY